MSCSVQAAPPITAAALAADGKHVVLGSQRGIEVRSWPDLEVTGNLATGLSHVHDLVFSPNGRMLLAAGGLPAEEGVVEVLSWPEGKRIHRVSEHTDLVYRAAWSPDGTQWTTASAEGICQVFAADTGQQLIRYEGHSRPVLAIRYLPDGKTIVSAGADQTLQVWECDTGRHLRTLDNHVGAVNDLAVRPAGSTDEAPIVASASDDRTVRIWQPTIGRLMRFARLPSAPRAVIWSEGGDRLMVGCNDGHLRVLDFETVKIAGDLPGLDGYVYSLVPDRTANRILLAGENGLLRICSIESGR
jgi:WD40 repeat protein